MDQVSNQRYSIDIISVNNSFCYLNTFVYNLFQYKKTMAWKIVSPNKIRFLFNWRCKYCLVLIRSRIEFKLILQFNMQLSKSKLVNRFVARFAWNKTNWLLDMTDEPYFIEHSEFWQPILKQFLAIKKQEKE